MFKRLIIFGAVLFTFSLLSISSFAEGDGGVDVSGGRLCIKKRQALLGKRVIYVTPDEVNGRKWITVSPTLTEEEAKVVLEFLLECPNEALGDEVWTS